MPTRIVPFAELTVAQLASAAQVLRDALAHIPETYSQPGEAEAEIQTFFTDDERAAWAALDGETVVGCRSTGNMVRCVHSRRVTSGARNSRLASSA